MAQAGRGRGSGSFRIARHKTTQNHVLSKRVVLNYLLAHLWVVRATGCGAAPHLWRAERLERDFCVSLPITVTSVIICQFQACGGSRRLLAVRVLVWRVHPPAR